PVRRAQRQSTWLLGWRCSFMRIEAFVMPTENICASIAGEPFGPDVPGRDEAVAIEQENGVILHAFDQQSKPLLTLPAGLLFDPFPESIQINEDRNLVFQNLRHD